MECIQSTANTSHTMDIEEPSKIFSSESTKGIRLVDSSTLLAAESYNEKIEIKDIERKVEKNAYSWDKQSLSPTRSESPDIQPFYDENEEEDKEEIVDDSSEVAMVTTNITSKLNHTNSFFENATKARAKLLRDIVPRQKVLDLQSLEKGGKIYLDRRKKNNEAAKRCREKRRVHDKNSETRIVELTAENNHLRSQLMAMHYMRREQQIRHDSIPFSGDLNRFYYERRDNFERKSSSEIYPGTEIFHPGHYQGSTDRDISTSQKFSPYEPKRGLGETNNYPPRASFLQEDNRDYVPSSPNSPPYRKDWHAERLRGIAAFLTHQKLSRNSIFRPSQTMQFSSNNPWQQGNKNLGPVGHRSM